ncbi:unnamed protein product, partial [Heligmosomoides polygyrus]|uniref:Envoplakin a n=1 Tax=Heligmosomoides polygyrus TaxID=6339 RepID=A0A183GG25_HELPZ
RQSEREIRGNISAALNVHRDDPLLQVYSSTQEKLDAVTAELQREKSRSKALESEVEDLQGEFELDRLDYLETIRKQDQQLKLLTQILEKVQPSIRKDSNYFNLEKVKKDAVWNEDEGRWILPEISVSRTVLPTAHNGVSYSDKSESLLRGTYDDDSSKLRRDSNYFNLEKVKKDAVWNEDEGRWILPEISVSRTVLPTAHNGTLFP